MKFVGNVLLTGETGTWMCSHELHKCILLSQRGHLLPLRHTTGLHALAVVAHEGCVRRQLSRIAAVHSLSHHDLLQSDKRVGEEHEGIMRFASGLQ